MILTPTKKFHFHSNARFIKQHKPCFKICDDDPSSRETDTSSHFSVAHVSVYQNVLCVCQSLGLTAKVGSMSTKVWFVSTKVGSVSAKVWFVSTKMGSMFAKVGSMSSKVCSMSAKVCSMSAKVGSRRAIR